MWSATPGSQHILFPGPCEGGPCWGAGELRAIGLDCCQKPWLTLHPALALPDLRLLMGNLPLAPAVKTQERSKALSAQPLACPERPIIAAVTAVQSLSIILFFRSFCTLEEMAGSLLVPSCTFSSWGLGKPGNSLAWCLLEALQPRLMAFQSDCFCTVGLVCSPREQTSVATVVQREERQGLHNEVKLFGDE